MFDVAYYIEFLSATGSTLNSLQRYQAYFPGETRTLNGSTYQFSPFSIAGDISTDGSEVGDHELIAPATMISAAKLWQASEERRLLRVQTVELLLAPPVDANSIPTWEELSVLTSTIYVCDSFGYTDSVPGEENQFSMVTLKLTSPLNFAAGTAPTRRLTFAQVGPLPSSGGITF